MKLFVYVCIRACLIILMCVCVYMYLWIFTMYDEQHISGIIDFIYASSLVPLSNGRYGSFATGGCDGFVNVWDGTNKKRLCQVYRERERA